MGKIKVIAEIEPKGEFPVVSAPNVKVGNTTLDAAMSAATTAINGKVDKVTGKGLSTNDYTTAEKNKLAGIAAGATAVTVDDALSSSSTNPVQNKVINTALGNKADSSTVSSLASTVATKADSSTVSSLSSQVGTNTTDIAIQTARIDAIASLPSGSTSGDAELIDIRTKANGATASNAGTAVREQITAVNDNIDRYADSQALAYIPHINLLAFNTTYYVDDCYYTGINKQSIPTANVGALSPIPIKAGKTYYYYSLYAYYCWIAYADGTTPTRFSSTTASAENGSFTAVKDGLVYITVDKRRWVNNTGCLFTDSQDMYNNAKFDLDTSFIETDAVNSPKVNSLLMNSGVPYTKFTGGGTARNGAEIDTGNMELTIPTGSTGRDSFLAAQFDIRDYGITVGTKIYAIIGIDTNYTDGFTFDVNYSTGLWVTKKQLIDKIDNTSWYYLEIEYKSDNPFKIFYQIASYAATATEDLYVRFIKPRLYFIENTDSIATVDEVVKKVIEYNLGHPFTNSKAKGNGVDGATINLTDYSLTIPTGSTGATSYISAEFDIRGYGVNVGDSVYAVIGLERPARTGDLFNANATNGLWFKNTTVLKVEGNITWYLIEIEYKSDDPFKIFYQISSVASAVSEDTTIRLHDARLYFYHTNETQQTVVIQVGADKPFTSLRTALEYATSKANASTHYEVQMFYDDYNVINDLTQEELSEGSSYVGLTVTDYVKLLGMNNYRKTVIRLSLPASTPGSVRQRISTLNLKDSGELENLTVYAEHCRYAVHDDYVSRTDRVKTVKNCRFVSDATYYARAYGAGFRSGDRWNFENCIFESINDQSGYAPFSAHNNLSFAKPAVISFENCRFIGNTNGAQFSSLTNDTDIINTIVFKGCKIECTGSPVYLHENSAPLYGAGCLMSVTGCNNSFGNSDVEIQVTDGKDYSDRVDLFNV